MPLGSSHAPRHSLFLPRRHRPLAAFFGVAAACGSLVASPADTGLSLAGAQRLALERNSDLAIARAQVDAARAQLQTAREWQNPVLSVSVAKIATDGAGNGTRDGNRFLNRSYDSIASLSQLLELGGKRGLREASARAGKRVAEAQRDDVRRLLLLSVTEAYVSALEARAEAGVLEDSAASLHREAEIAGHRLTAGDVSQTDQVQIEIAATQLELQATAARHAASASVIALETILGNPSPGGTTPLSDNLANLPLPAEGIENLPVSGLRPDLAAAEAALEKAEADLRVEKRARVPDLTVSAQYERNPPDQTNTVGVGISLPLPVWNFHAGAIHGARAVRDQAQAQLDKARTQAGAEVAQARLAWREARLRAETYRVQLVPKAANIALAVSYAYERGGSSLVELLAAKRSENEIRVAAEQAAADAANAQVALAAALNRIDALSNPSTR